MKDSNSVIKYNTHLGRLYFSAFLPVSVRRTKRLYQNRLRRSLIMAVWRPLLEIRLNYNNNDLFRKLYVTFEYFDVKRSAVNKLGETDVNKA